jgi:hypothetical protein
MNGELSQTFQRNVKANFGWRGSDEGTTSSQSASLSIGPGKPDEGASGMSRPQSRRDEKEVSSTWLGIASVLALVVSLIVTWRPAAADTTSTQNPFATSTVLSSATSTFVRSVTPTAVPSPTSKVGPSVTPTVAKTASAPVRARLTGPQACVAGPPNTEPSMQNPCPIALGVKFDNVDAPGAALRVGDTAKITIVANNSSNTIATYGFSTYLDFNIADYQIMAGSSPMPNGSSGVFQIPTHLGTGELSVFGGVNTFSIYNNTGHLDLDVIVNPATLSATLPSGETDLAWFFARVRKNESSASGLLTSYGAIAPFEVRILESNNVGTLRNSVVAGGASVEGANIMSGRMTTANRNGMPEVVQTDIKLSARDARPNPGTMRVGEVIPIDILVTAPMGGVRHLNAIQPVISTQQGFFRWVDASGNPFTYQGRPMVPYIGTGQQLVWCCENGTINPANTNEIALDVTGSNVLVLGANESAVVGRVYIQPLLQTPNGSSAEAVKIEMRGLKVGERQQADGSIAYTLPVQRWYGNPEYCTDYGLCSVLYANDIRGTVGISLEVRSPMADAPDLMSNTPAFVLGNDTAHPFIAVQGRFVDVAVFVDASSSPTQNGEANRFNIDLNYPIEEFFGDSFEFVPAAGFEVSETPPSPQVGLISIRARRQTGTITARTEIGRVRLRLRDVQYSFIRSFKITILPSTQNAYTCTHVGTSIWNDQSPFCEIYAAPVWANSTGTGEFDKNATVVEHPAASLQVTARLQGRRPTDPLERFVQPVDVILFEPGTQQPKARRLTPPTHSWNYAPVERAPTTFSFQTSTAPFVNSSGGICDSPSVTLTPPSNIVLASNGNSCPINSIEPGVYDVYIKGRSSVGVLVKNVPFEPGQFRTLTGLTLREGDIEQGNGETDRVNIADFAAFSAAYNGYPANDYWQSASTNWNPKADLNQSGFIDILDFSLLATNYPTTGPTQIDLGPIDLANGLSLSPTPVTVGARVPQTFNVKLDVGTNTLQSAVVTVQPSFAFSDPSDAGNYYPAHICNGYVCVYDGQQLQIFFNGNGTGQVDLGSFSVNTFTKGVMTLLVRVDAADGTTGSFASHASFKSSELVTSFNVAPSVTWDFQIAPVPAHPNQFTAEIVMQPAMGFKVTDGWVELSFPYTWPDALEAVCPSAPVPGATCEIYYYGSFIRFILGSEEGLPVDASGKIHLGPVTFTYSPPSDFSLWTQLSARVDIYPMVSSEPKRFQSVQRNISLTGNSDAPIFSVNRVRAAAVRTEAVRTRSTSPNANLWVRTATTEAKVGDIIPVQVGVTTGVRAIDGAQVALKAAPGTRFVDHDGNVVTNSTAFSASGVLPNILRQAVDVGRGLLQVALGRTFASASSGVAGDGVLGTVYLEVTGPVSGDLVTIERTGTQNFTTMVAGDGDDLTGSLIGLSNTITIDTPVTSSPQAGTGPVIGGSAGVVLPAPSAPSGSARNATAARPASSPATATRVTTPARVTTTARGLTEDRALGTITLNVPGRSLPVELRTGLLPIAPDQYCPVMRHQTYIRLQDVGIAGATFGVEPGGVLSWISPDRAGCVDWTAISEGGLTFTKETIMQFQLARAVPGALLWVLEGGRNGELYEVDAQGVATYVTAEAFAANQDHFTQVWANVIPVSSTQIEGLAARGSVKR